MDQLALPPEAYPLPTSPASSPVYEGSNILMRRRSTVSFHDSDILAVDSPLYDGDDGNRPRTAPVASTSTKHLLEHTISNDTSTLTITDASICDIQTPPIEAYRGQKRRDSRREPLRPVSKLAFNRLLNVSSEFIGTRALFNIPQENIGSDQETKVTHYSVPDERHFSSRRKSRSSSHYLRSLSDTRRSSFVQDLPKNGLRARQPRIRVTKSVVFRKSASDGWGFPRFKARHRGSPRLRRSEPANAARAFEECYTFSKAEEERLGASSDTSCAVWRPVSRLPNIGIQRIKEDEVAFIEMGNSNSSQHKDDANAKSICSKLLEEHIQGPYINDEEDGYTLTPLEMQAMGPIVPVAKSPTIQLDLLPSLSESIIGKRRGIRRYSASGDEDFEVSAPPLKISGFRKRKHKENIKPCPDDNPRSLSAVKKHPNFLVRLWRSGIPWQSSANDLGRSECRAGFRDNIRRRLVHSSFLQNFFKDVPTPESDLMLNIGNHYGSDDIHKELTLPRDCPSMDAFVHHPLTPHILVAKESKIFRESGFREKDDPEASQGNAICQNSQFHNSLFSRRWEADKFINRGKRITPRIGDGELNFINFIPPSSSLGISITEQQNATALLAPGELPFPPKRITSFDSKTDKKSVSSISWSENIQEFDGGVGSVRPVGERSLSCETKGSSSWESVDPDMLYLLETDGGLAVLDYDTVYDTVCDSEMVNARPADEPLDEDPVTGIRLVSETWHDALQLMNEFHQNSVSPKRSSKSMSFPEGYADDDLKEACRVALNSAKMLESL